MSLATACSGAVVFLLLTSSAAQPSTEQPQQSNTTLSLQSTQTQDTHLQILKAIPRNVVGLSITATAGALATAAGVGGGAFFVPMFNVLLQFSLKGSTAMSQAVITGGAIAGVAVTFTKRHPLDSSLPLIDFQLALVLTPVLLFGTSIGVLLNKLFPIWIITFLLVAMLVFLTWKTGKKGLQLFRREQRAARRRAERAAAADVEAPQSPSPTHLDHDDPFLSGASTPVAGAAPADRQLQGRQGPAPLEMVAAAQRFALSAQQAGADSHQGASPHTDQQRNNRGGSIDTSTASAHIMAGAGHAALANSQLRRRISDSTGGQQQEAAALDAGQQLPATPENGLIVSNRVRSGQLRELRLVGEEGPQQKISDFISGLSEQRLDPDWDHNHPSTPTYSDDEEHEQRRLLPEGPSSPLQPATTAQLRRSGSERPSRTSLSIDGTGSGSWGPRQWHRWRRYSAGLPQLPLGAHAWQQVAQLTVLFVTFLLLQLFKSRSRNCSPAYFVLFVTQAVLCACATAVFLWRAATQQKQEASSNGNQAQLSAPVLRRQSSVGQDEAPAWTGRRLAMAACVTLAGGSIAGLLGIGGGMVMGPLFASFNVHPLVGAATSGLMVLFSSSAATLSFAIADAINLQYAMTYGILNLFASLVGVLLIGRIIRRSGRASLIVIILAVIIGVGACLTAGFQGRQAVSDLIHKTNLSFSPFCAPT